MGNKYKVQKVSDRFKAGVSDWLIFHEGMVIAIESKYIMRVPSQPGTKLLRHVVSGPQRTYMKTMVEAHVPCWVIVGIGTERKIVAVPFSEVPATGNWTAAEFLAQQKSLFAYPYNEIPKMIIGMFAHAASAYQGRHDAT
ncbi:MAG: hypothetical protein MUP21_13425 [Dehalococcoidia bacterium]|nr:hypothetical protein [Dehalococcoidia bacterium]